MDIYSKFDVIVSDSGGAGGGGGGSRGSSSMSAASVLRILSGQELNRLVLACGQS